MDRISLDDVDASATPGDGRSRCLTDALDLSNAAINHYRIPPGEGLPAGLHAHMDQEEIFVVLDGVAVFETMDGERTVAPGEAIRFAPGEYQSARNGGGQTDLAVLAVGAPRDSEDVRLPAVCPDCEHGNLRIDTDDGLTFVCPDCGESFVPDGCPDCGAPAMQMTLDAEQSGDDPDPVAACQECGATFPEPPLSD
jgi:uncharacterized cupin superfamily protein